MKIPKVYKMGAKRHSRQWNDELQEIPGGQNNGIDYIAYYWTGCVTTNIRFIKSAKFLWRRINRKNKCLKKL